MMRLLREAVLYSAASAVGLAADVSFLWVLVERLHWHYLLAATLAFVGGTILVYALSVTLVFRHRRVADRRIEFGTFAVIGVIGLAINLIVLRLAVEMLDAHYLVGKLIAVLFTFSLNFGLRKSLLFSKPDYMRPTDAELD